jgi:chemotaxis protein CheY-P-specific phosphatase CheC
MRATASATPELSALLSIGAAQGAQALAGLLGGEARAGRLFEPESGALADYETGVAFEVGEGLVASVLVLFASRVRERLLRALGSGAQADPDAALSEVANIVASQAISAIADELRARVTLSVPQLCERGSEVVLARALRPDTPALASELWTDRTGTCALLVLLPGGAPRSAIP